MSDICMPLGAAISAVDPAGSPQFGVGNRAYDNAGNVYLYLKYDTAGTGLGLGMGVVLPGTSNQAQGLTLALSSGGQSIGFCQAGSAATAVAVTAGAFFWAQIEGEGKVAVASACAAGVPLYTTAVAGVLDDASNGNIIHGVTINTSVTGNGFTAATGKILGGRAGANIA